MENLHCPFCDGEHIHQARVEVGFRRKEDEKASNCVMVARNKVSSDIKMLGGRRDELFIHFWCEDCSPEAHVHNPEAYVHNCGNELEDNDQRADFALRVYQHKGQTMTEWWTYRMSKMGGK
jgi:hypothetical protein